jgi:hypothetical protein
VATPDVRRLATVVVPIALVVAVVVAVLTLGGNDDGGPGDAGGPGSTSTSSDAVPTTAATVRPSPEQWCEQFRAFTEASNGYVAAPGTETADELNRVGLELLALGQPLGLSDGGMTSLQQLVFGSLGEAGGPSDAPTGAPADGPALDGYLATTCPA